MTSPTAGHRLLAALAAVIVVTSGASAVAAPLGSRQTYERARGDYFTLKGNAQRQKFRHNWLKVIGLFNEVASNFPDSVEAPAAVYTMAELWADLFAISRRDSDLDQALAAYERVVVRYPASTLADDALLGRAQIYLKTLKNRPAAARAAREILARYKDGDMAPRAMALLAELKDVPEEAPRTADQAESAVAAGPLVGHRSDAGPMPLVTDLRHWSDPIYSRVAIYLSGAAQAHVGEVPASATSPAKIYVDIRRAKLAKDVARELTPKDDLLRHVELATRDRDTVRAILDLKAPARPRVMVMENPYRVVIDAFATPEVARTSAPDLRGRHVVVDPGHGGKDTGARGPGRALEKDIVLKVALSVASLLGKAGVEVTLTRDADVTVSLEERTAIANRAQADVFVSIHGNSNPTATVNGIETFYLDVTDDAYALKLAAHENQTNEEQVSDLQLILADLATKVNTEESRTLARTVQQALCKAATNDNPKVKDLGVKPSLFYVLLGARMPAILIETGFLSNEREGKLLVTGGYESALAAAIADAVVAHLKEPPPVGE